jgi:hypothetical protein
MYEGLPERLRQWWRGRQDLPISLVFGVLAVLVGGAFIALMVMAVAR